MSVYNGERFLRESVDSVLSQTHRNLELILVNDGSTDTGASVVRQYDDARIHLIDRSENVGLTKSLNEGIACARGKYIARLDVGDYALPTRLEEQVRFLENHPDVGILGSGIDFSYGGHSLRTFTYAEDHDRIADLLLRFTNPLPHSTLLFRRAVLRQLEGYCPAFVRSQDYDILLRALACTRLASLPRVLVRWRFDPSSITYGSSQQLTYGIAALVRARHRMAGHSDIVRSDHWVRFLETVAQFVRRHRLDQKTGAAKYRILAQCAFSERRWGDCGAHVARLLVQNPLFFVHTGAWVNAFIAKRIDGLLPCSGLCKP